MATVSRNKVLKDREESRKALESMLQLIVVTVDYIRNYTETCRGSLLLLILALNCGADTHIEIFITQEYKKKIDDFKEKFREQMELLQFCVALEAFKGIHSLGASIRISFDFRANIYPRARLEIEGDTSFCDGALQNRRRSDVPGRH